MTGTILAGLLVATVAMGVVGLGGGDAAAAEPVRSLRGAAVDDADRVPAVWPPSEGHRFDRGFAEQPPMIPHRVDRDQVDLKVNQCLGCHDWPNSARWDAPAVSVTHYVDRSGVKREQVAGERWFCTQCHAPQADARPLVANRFRSATDRESR
jgi:cytochrome c-type protein NapB